MCLKCNSSNLEAFLFQYVLVIVGFFYIILTLFFIYKSKASMQIKYFNEKKKEEDCKT